jgi:hypothetical protein
MTRRAWTMTGVVAVLALACLAPFASSSPDGLERVAEKHGISAAEPVWNQAPLSDYRLPGMRPAGSSTVLAGLLGTLLVLGFGLVAGRWCARRQVP